MVRRAIKDQHEQERMNAPMEELYALIISPITQSIPFLAARCVHGSLSEPSLAAEMEE